MIKLLLNNVNNSSYPFKSKPFHKKGEFIQHPNFIIKHPSCSAIKQPAYILKHITARYT
jgi:hypothetical protein